MPLIRVAMLSYHTCPLALQEGKETGGMNVYVLELSKELARQGIYVDAFTRSQDETQPHVVQVTKNFRVIHLPAGPESPVPKKDLSQYVPEFVESYLTFVEKEKLEYDVFHAHYYLSGMAAQQINAKTTKQTPIVMSFHTLALMKNLVARNEQEREGQSRVEAELELVKQATHIIAPSQSDKKYLKYFYQAQESKIKVIPPGVDVKRFKPLNQTHAKAKIGISDTDKIILFCGRIEPLKGIDMLLYAVKILLEKNPELDICLWIVGGDVSQEKDQWSKELQRLEQLRHQLQLTAVVHFAGQQSQDSLPYYYNAAEVVVLPSHYESFGMAAAEAMACGVPVITTNVAGISGLLDGHHRNLLASVNNPLLLAAKIEKLLTDPQRRSWLSRELHTLAQTLNWSSVAGQVLEVYKKSLIID
jgi:D-inositol-3-phosphate glycosyltransferase